MIESWNIIIIHMMSRPPRKIGKILIWVHVHVHSSLTAGFSHDRWFGKRIEGDLRRQRLKETENYIMSMPSSHLRCTLPRAMRVFVRDSPNAECSNLCKLSHSLSFHPKRCKLQAFLSCPRLTWAFQFVRSVAQRSLPLPAEDAKRPATRCLRAKKSDISSSL